MVAFFKGNFENMNKLAHVIDSSRESIPKFRDLNELKSGVSLDPSSEHIGICKMVVISRADDVD